MNRSFWKVLNLFSLGRGVRAVSFTINVCRIHMPVTWGTFFYLLSMNIGNLATSNNFDTLFD